LILSQGCLIAGLMQQTIPCCSK